MTGITRRLVGICWSGVLGVALAATAAAQGQATSGAVVLTAFGEWRGPEMFVQTGRSFEPTEITPASYTGPLEVPLPFVVYQRNPAAAVPENGEGATPAAGGDAQAPAYLPITDPIVVPEGMRNPLVILRWDATAKKAQGLVLDNDPGAVPWGAYQVVNLSGRTVGLRFTGREPVVARPGQNVVVNPGFTEPTMSGIQLLAEVRDEQNRAKLVPSPLSTQTMVNPNRRTIILVADDPRHPSGVAYQSLIDFRQPSAEEMARNLRAMPDSVDETDDAAPGSEDAEEGASE